MNLINESQSGVCDLDLEIAKGNVSGVAGVNKFGHSSNVDTGVATDIWDRANASDDQDIWIAPTQARVHAIASTSDDDSDSGGTNPQSDGARTLRIYGLTDWDTAEVSEDIILDGTQSVDTTNSYVIIHRMKILTKGDNVAGPNVGVITATANVDGTVTAQINAINGQTQMTIYGIPSTQIFYMSQFRVSLLRGTGVAVLVDVGILFNPEPDNERTNFLVKDVVCKSSTGTSDGTPVLYKPYKKFSGPGIIKMQANASALNTDVFANFDGYLIDN